MSLFIDNPWPADRQTKTSTNPVVHYLCCLLLICVRSCLPPPLFPHIALISLCTSQMLLQGFFRNSFLFASPVTSWTRWNTRQQALCVCVWERESAHSGERKKEEEKSKQRKTLRFGRGSNPWTLTPESSALITRPQHPEYLVKLVTLKRPSNGSEKFVHLLKIRSTCSRPMRETFIQSIKFKWLIMA